MKYNSIYGNTNLEVEPKDSHLKFSFPTGSVIIAKDTVKKLIEDAKYWLDNGRFKPQGKSYKATFANGYQTTIKGDKFTYVLSQISDDKQYRGKGGLVKLEICNC